MSQNSDLSYVSGVGTQPLLGETIGACFDRIVEVAMARIEQRLKIARHGFLEAEEIDRGRHFVFAVRVIVEQPVENGRRM